MKQISHLLCLGALATLLSGCVIAMGNRDFPASKASSATVGQQLIDLKKAREAGALTDAEYEAQKGKLLGEKSHSK